MQGVNMEDGTMLQDSHHEPIWWISHDSVTHMPTLLFIDYKPIYLTSWRFEIYFNIKSKSTQIELALFRKIYPDKVNFYDQKGFSIKFSVYV